MVVMSYVTKLLAVCLVYVLVAFYIIWLLLLRSHNAFTQATVVLIQRRQTAIEEMEQGVGTGSMLNNTSYNSLAKIAFYIYNWKTSARNNTPSARPKLTWSHWNNIFHNIFECTFHNTYALFRLWFHFYFQCQIQYSFEVTENAY